MQTNPEQWAVDLWRKALAAYYGPTCVIPERAALAIQAAFAEREANAWKEADRQEALAKVYLRAQLTAEYKLCREIDNAKGWQKRAEYLGKQLAALKDRTNG